MNHVAAILAANIKGRRKVLHMTQLQLGERLGYSEKAISKWESGKGLPPTAILPRLARALEVTLDELMREPVQRPLFLGIDGGGTKTEFLLADGKGEILRRLVLGRSNPNDIGADAAKELLRKGILEICDEQPLHCISVFAGLAGGGTAGNTEMLQAFLSRFGFLSVQCGSDAHNAISAGLGTENGVAVIMGTGSIAFAQQEGRQHRFGGYGYLLGDAGSGFALGRDVIAAALHYEDGSGADTLLYDLVKKQCNGKTVLEKLGSFYEGGKALIAGYAPLLFTALAKKDAVAIAILHHHMQEVAKLIVGAAKQVKTDPVRVVLCGGLVFANRQYILPILEEYLKKEPRHYILSVCETSMAQGALYLAGMPRNQENMPC
ncbi:MAG: XRE family transcriptional regulator [Ruminococcaceae bacterium]|nr:XRE family transcriptional regulator [Oscillospiraceae bacterium]